MGCAQSRIENEEAVARCKERRQLMKSAVSSRNAFAAAHSAYAVSLKDTGAALSEFAQGESHPLPSSPSRSSASGAAAAVPPISVAAMAAMRPPIDNLPPPPPPLPEFSPSPAKMQRSISMPEIPPDKLPTKPPLPHSASIQEEEEEEEEQREEEMDDGHLDDRRRRQRHHLRRAEKPPPASLPQQSNPPPSPPLIHEGWDYFFAMDSRMSGASLGAGEEIGQDGDEEELEEEDDKFTRSPPPPLTPPEEPMTPEPPPPLRPANPLPPLPPKPPGRKGGPTIHHQHAVSAPPLDVQRGKMVASETPGVSLLQILAELDEHFLKASESAHEVSKMLEANKMHYHSNFADNRGKDVAFF